MTEDGVTLFTLQMTEAYKSAQGHTRSLGRFPESESWWVLGSPPLSLLRPWPGTAPHDSLGSGSWGRGVQSRVPPHSLASCFKPHPAWAPAFRAASDFSFFGWGRGGR